MTEKEAEKLLKQAGQGQKMPAALHRGQKPDGVTSEGEKAFIGLCRILRPSFPAPWPQFQPHPLRRWRVDFAWPDVLLIVEIEGVGHRLSPRYEQDIEKYNDLSASGYTILRITDKMLRDNPEPFFALIERIYKERTNTE